MMKSPTVAFSRIGAFCSRVDIFSIWFNTVWAKFDSPRRTALCLVLIVTLDRILLIPRLDLFNGGEMLETLAYLLGAGVPKVDMIINVENFVISNNLSCKPK